MSSSLEQCRRKLQQRVLLEMQHQSNQEAHGTPAAASAGRSSAAKTRRVQAVRQEREARGGTLAIEQADQLMASWWDTDLGSAVLDKCIEYNGFTREIDEPMKGGSLAHQRHVISV